MLFFCWNSLIETKCERLETLVLLVTCHPSQHPSYPEHAYQLVLFFIWSCLSWTCQHKNKPLRKQYFNVSYASQVSLSQYQWYVWFSLLNKCFLILQMRLLFNVHVVNNKHFNRLIYYCAKQVMAYRWNKKLEINPVPTW